MWGISLRYGSTTQFTHSHLQIYTAQIAESLPERPKLAQGELEQYLKVLVDDQVRKMAVSLSFLPSLVFPIWSFLTLTHTRLFSQAKFLHKTGDSGGGSFVVSILSN